MSEEKCFIQCLMLWTIFIPNVSLYILKCYLLEDIATATQDYVHRYLKSKSYRRAICGLDTIQMWSYLSRWLRKAKDLKIQPANFLGESFFPLCTRYEASEIIRPCENITSTLFSALYYGNYPKAQCLRLFFFKKKNNQNQVLESLDYVSTLLFFFFCLKSPQKRK